MSHETPLSTVSTTIRADEVVAIDEYADKQEKPYAGNRAAALRYLIRLGMEREGIAIDPLTDERKK